MLARAVLKTVSLSLSFGAAYRTSDMIKVV